MSVTLFDLPSRGGNRCWSLNPWKTRLMLNYKNIPYKTEWVEYPDIAPTFKGFGLPENKEGMAYTIPAVKLSDGTPIMDSKPIAIALEKQYPSPSLHLDSPILPEVEATVPKCHVALAPVVMPQIPQNILNPESQGYFESTRAKRFGMPLAQYGKENGGDKAWDAAKPGIEGLAAILKKNGGPFVQGKEPSYADFVIAGWLQFYKRVNEDVYKRVVAHDPAFEKLHDACKPWLARDDH